MSKRKSVYRQREDENEDEYEDVGGEHPLEQLMTSMKLTRTVDKSRPIKIADYAEDLLEELRTIRPLFPHMGEGSKEYIRKRVANDALRKSIGAMVHIVTTKTGIDNDEIYQPSPFVSHSLRNLLHDLANGDITRDEFFERTKRSFSRPLMYTLPKEDQYGRIGEYYDNFLAGYVNDYKKSMEGMESIPYIENFINRVRPFAFGRIRRRIFRRKGSRKSSKRRTSKRR